MNIFIIFTLKAIRKICTKYIYKSDGLLMPRIDSFDIASEKIYELLSSDKPCMVARFGSTELECLINFLSVNNPKRSLISYFTGKQKEWWWNKTVMEQMQQWSGFFPSNVGALSKFCKLMLFDIKQLNLLGSWCDKNEYMIKNMLSNVEKVALITLDPYWSSKPWTRGLKGKKVLVIHPFADLIEQQYKENRTKLFKNPDVLPEFELHTIRAVQSLGGEANGFNDWFEALRYMEEEMDKCDYDIALIGCGAYGFPLAAHAKRMGRKAVHLGGALQLLFGIKGKRWENPDYGYKELGRKDMYSSLFNEYWIRPDEMYKPKSAKNIEGGCYW